jgi:protein TonB
MIEAEFPGGDDGWSKFVFENVNAKVPIKNKAPVGVYKVIISFVVDEKGKVSNIKPVTNFGYGMEEEAMRVIRKSPRWSPLIYLGEQMKAFRVQPFSFVING